MTVYVVREWFAGTSGISREKYVGVSDALIGAMLKAQGDSMTVLGLCIDSGVDVDDYKPKLNMPGMPDMFDPVHDDLRNNGPYHEIIAEEV